MFDLSIVLIDLMFQEAISGDCLKKKKKKSKSLLSELGNINLHRFQFLQPLYHSNLNIMILTRMLQYYRYLPASHLPEALINIKYYPSWGKAKWNS